jgi:anti-sigma regulatory factor (Ser/Thr protein kinase)
MRTTTSSTTTSGAATERVLSSEDISGWGGEGLRTELLPLVRRSLEREERVQAVVDEATRRVLVRALGRRSRQVNFADPAEVYAGYSAQAVAVDRGRAVIGLAPDGRDQGCLVVEQYGDALTSPERPESFWRELGRASEAVLGHLRVTLVRRVGPVAGARGQGPTPPPPPRPEPDVTLDFGYHELRALRAELARHAERAGLDEDRASALVLAAGEVTTNSVEHGSGSGTLLLWLGPTALTIEVHDSGQLADSHQGLRRPELTGTRGRGLWMARQLCDHVHVWTDSAGTHVRQSVYRTSAQRFNSAARPLSA